MLTTAPGPTFMKNDGQSGARSGDHTHSAVIAIAAAAAAVAVANRWRRAVLLVVIVFSLAGRDP
jgi:hypothetical protein